MSQYIFQVSVIHSQTQILFYYSRVLIFQVNKQKTKKFKYTVKFLGSSKFKVHMRLFFAEVILKAKIIHVSMQFVIYSFTFYLNRLN